MDYKIVAEIPFTDVPEHVGYQEANVVAEIWLKHKIPDATFIKLELGINQE